MSKTRMHRLTVRMALSLGLGLVPGWAASPAEAGASTNDNACYQAATATYLTVPIGLSGADSPDPVTVGDQVTLSGASVQGVFDATLYVAAYRLGLLTTGANSVPASVSVNILASNTVESFNFQAIPTSLTVTIIDPTPADSSSGDESALPLAVNLPLADSVWTASGGTINFTQGTVLVETVVAALIINLGPCSPSAGLTGCDAGDTNCTGFTPDTDPTPFESTTVSGSLEEFIDNACYQAVTATYRTVPIRLTGTDNPDPVNVGSQVTLSGASVQGTFDASIFVAAYRLGLLTTGANSVPATVSVTLLASNTLEASHLQAIATSLTVTIIDPTPADTSNGDESALPLVVGLPLADSVWTASGGTIEFTQGTVAVETVVDGIIINFAPCNPSAGLTGCDIEGEHCTGYTPDTDPTPLETTTVNGSPEEFIDNACYQAVTATYLSVPIRLAGTDIPDPVGVGEQVTLSGASIQGTYDATVFVAAYRLGELTTGANSVPATVSVNILASNTLEGSNQQAIATSLTVTIIDPTPADRTSGDESALPLVVNLPLADSVWTASGGTIDFTQGTVAVHTVVDGIIINFAPCSPSAGLTGCDLNGDHCTGFTPDPDPRPFGTTNVNGSPEEFIDNACFQAATATYQTVPIRLTGTDIPDPVDVGDQVTLTGASIQGAFDATVFVAAYRLGELTTGANSVPATVSVTLLASNTLEASHLQAIATSLTVTIIDPTPADRTSGDESALPLVVNLPLADSVWTATGGIIDFTQGTVAVETVAGIIVINFAPCSPSAGLTGCDLNGDHCTGYTPDTDPAPFETTSMSIAADLQITKTSDAIVYKPPSIVLYTIAVRNEGPVVASGVVVTDDLPLRPKDEVILLPDPGCSIPIGGTLLTCSLGTIAPGETKRVHVSIRFKGSRGAVRNTATVFSDTFDPVPGNNSSTRDILIGPQSKL
jgi:uncharacterized repeat protein (TIGR01451 family)